LLWQFSNCSAKYNKKIRISKYYLIFSNIKNKIAIVAVNKNYEQKKAPPLPAELFSVRSEK